MDDRHKNQQRANAFWIGWMMAFDFTGRIGNSVLPSKDTPYTNQLKSDFSEESSFSRERNAEQIGAYWRNVGNYISAAVIPVEENDEELVELTRTEWWRENRFRVLSGYRHKHDMSQEELARRSGIARSVIALYESGKRRITPRAAEKLGRALGEDPQKLLAE